MSESKAKAYLSKIKRQESECVIDPDFAKSFNWFNALVKDHRSKHLIVGSEYKLLKVTIKNKETEVETISQHVKAMLCWEDFYVVGDNDKSIQLWKGSEMMWRSDVGMSIRVFGCGDDHVLGFQVQSHFLYVIVDTFKLLKVNLKKIKANLYTPLKDEEVMESIDTEVQCLSVVRETGALFYLKGSAGNQTLIKQRVEIAKLKDDQQIPFSKMAANRKWIACFNEGYVIALLDHKGKEKNRIDMRTSAIEKSNFLLMQMGFFERCGISFLVASHQSNLGSLFAVNNGKLLPVQVCFDVQMKDKVDGSNSVFGFHVVLESSNKMEFSIIFYGYSILTRIRFQVK